MHICMYTSIYWCIYVNIDAYFHIDFNVIIFK